MYTNPLHQDQATPPAGMPALRYIVEHPRCHPRSASALHKVESIDKSNMTATVPKHVT